MAQKCLFSCALQGDLGDARGSWWHHCKQKGLGWWLRSSAMEWGWCLGWEGLREC